MQLYDKLKPLLEEYFRVSDEWRAQEAWQAIQNPAWNFRQRELKARRRELQSQIQHLTNLDRRLVN